MTRVVSFYSSVNTRGKYDASGAFEPEARAFSEYWDERGADVYMYGVDCVNRPPDVRRRSVLKHLDNFPNGIDLLAFFCHGYPTGVQFGFKIKDIPELVSRIPLTDTGRIVLYACSAGQKFAPELATKIADHNRAWSGWVDGHTTKGHTTHNPNVVRSYFGAGVTLGQGDRREWRRLLKTDFRFAFPMAIEDQIDNILKF